jgi:hypothetical protein
MNDQQTSQKRKTRQRASSTSSIRVNSTINNPNALLIIRAVATLLHSNLLDDIQDGKTIPVKSDLYFFSEDKYINENPNNFDDERIQLLRKLPGLDDIANFIEVIYFLKKLGYL